MFRWQTWYTGCTQKGFHIATDEHAWVYNVLLLSGWVPLKTKSRGERERERLGGIYTVSGDVFLGNVILCVAFLLLWESTPPRKHQLSSEVHLTTASDCLRLVSFCIGRQETIRNVLSKQTTPPATVADLRVQNVPCRTC